MSWLVEYWEIIAGFSAMVAVAFGAGTGAVIWIGKAITKSVTPLAAAVEGLRKEFSDLRTDLSGIRGRIDGLDPGDILNVAREAAEARSSHVARDVAEEVVAEHVNRYHIKQNPPTQPISTENHD
ncbi:MAG: hypothetical protein Q8P44_01175 [Dehalococcoidia bacterium]|nr:hypothetical protein [Dehalococcoidia bacterium]